MKCLMASLMARPHIEVSTVDRVTLTFESLLVFALCYEYLDGTGSEGWDER